jgi:hypothetical protein
MKRLLTFFLVLALMGTISACKEDTTPAEEIPQVTTTGQSEEPIDFEGVLRQEAFPEEDEFHDLLNEVVVFEGFSVEETKVCFQVQAPYIYEDLVAWYEAQDDINDALLSEKITQLLKGEKRTVEIALDYEVQNGTVIYAYTNDYLSAAGCGIREFYAYIYAKVMGG